LLSRRRPLSPREDERERITSARRAAEALFTTKRQVTTQSVSDPLPSVSQSEHKPRVLKALSPVPVGHQEGNAPVDFKHQITPEIPSSQFCTHPRLGEVRDDSGSSRGDVRGQRRCDRADSHTRLTADSSRSTGADVGASLRDNPEGSVRSRDSNADDRAQRAISLKPD
jgi:hypothetical protein